MGYTVPESISRCNGYNIIICGHDSWNATDHCNVLECPGHIMKCPDDNHWRYIAIAKTQDHPNE